MKRSRMPELRRPLGATEIKLLWSLREPSYLRDSSCGIVPVDGQANFGGIRFRRRNGGFKEFSEPRHPLEISGPCFRSIFVWPVEKAQRGCSRSVEVNRIGDMNIGYLQMQRGQLKIWLICIEHQSIDLFSAHDRRQRPQ